LNKKAQEFCTDKQTYFAKAKSWTQKHATESFDSNTVSFCYIFTCI